MKCNKKIIPQFRQPLKPNACNIRIPYSGGGTPSVPSYLLLNTLDYVLLNDGSKILLN